MDFSLTADWLLWLFTDSMCGICEYKKMNKLIDLIFGTDRTEDWILYTNNQTEVIGISKKSIQ